MNVKMEKLLDKLWGLTGEIGTLSETTNSAEYAKIYEKLSNALDIAEIIGYKHNIKTKK